jgi:hypothetical protein
VARSVFFGGKFPRDMSFGDFVGKNYRYHVCCLTSAAATVDHYANDLCFVDTWLNPIVQSQKRFSWRSHYVNTRLYNHRYSSSYLRAAD